MLADSLDEKTCEFPTVDSDGLPKAGIANGANERGAPEAPAFPIVLNEIFDERIDERVVRLGREQPIARLGSVLEMVRDHRIEKLVLAPESRIERTC